MMSENRTIQAKNYFENIANINTANFIYEREEKTEFLYLIVLTSLQSDWENTNAENIPLENYAETLENWKIYQNETIKSILEEFNEKSTINLQVYFLNKTNTIDTDLEDKIEPLTKNIILVADVFSLQFEENKKIAQLFDTKDKDKIGGCLLPFCEHFSENQTIFAKELKENTFKRLTKAWHSEFYKSYKHVELDVPNKTYFFRRLANIAFLKGITEKETMAILSITEKQFSQPKERP